MFTSMTGDITSDQATYLCSLACAHEEHVEPAKKSYKHDHDDREHGDADNGYIAVGPAVAVHTARDRRGGVDTKKTNNKERKKERKKKERKKTRGN